LRVIPFKHTRSFEVTETGMQTRTIPSSGQPLPVIGCGTWKGFDVGAHKADRARLASVLETLIAQGGSVIDSSPMYGRAEAVAGDLLTAGNLHGKAFVATKVWTQGRDAGISQMRRSMKLLQRERIDLMQIHNLVDWRTHLATLRAWKAEGRISYLGVTHYTSSAYGELEAVMRSETLDFVQLNYSLDDRAAEQCLLPLAAERGIAVLVNLPFGAGRLVHTLQGKPVPSWASEMGCACWAQVLLKFVLAHPSVTCVIPGTGQPEHIAENCRAGTGQFLDEKLCNQLRAYWDAAGR
jgi:diketogulonate reductase-like aldo/keto reductase